MSSRCFVRRYSLCGLFVLLGLTGLCGPALAENPDAWTAVKVKAFRHAYLNKLASDPVAPTEMVTVPDRNILLVTAGKGLFAFDQEQLLPLWHSEQEADISEGVIVEGGTAFCAAGQSILALDVNNEGRLLWKHEVGAAVFPPVGSADHVITVDANGKVHRLRKRDGQPETELVPVAGTVSRSPVLFGGFLAFHVNDFIIVLDVDSGDEVWRKDISAYGPVVSPLVAERGTLCFLTHSDRTYQGRPNMVLACCYTLADRQNGGGTEQLLPVASWSKSVPVQFGSRYLDTEGVVVFPLRQGMQGLKFIRHPVVVLPPRPDQIQKQGRWMITQTMMTLGFWNDALTARRQLRSLYSTGIFDMVPTWDQRTRLVPDTTEARFFDETYIQAFSINFGTIGDALDRSTAHIAAAAQNWDRVATRISLPNEKAGQQLMAIGAEWSALPADRKVHEMGAYQLRSYNRFVQDLKFRPTTQVLNETSGVMENLVFERGSGVPTPLQVLAGTIVISAGRIDDAHFDADLAFLAGQGGLITELTSVESEPRPGIYAATTNSNNRFVPSGPRGGLFGGRLLVANGETLEVHRLHSCEFGMDPEQRYFSSAFPVVHVLANEPVNRFWSLNSNLTTDRTLLKTYDPGVVCTAPPMVNDKGRVYLAGTHRGKPVITLCADMDLQVEPDTAASIPSF